MTSGTGRYGDLIPQDTGLVDECWIPFFHTDGTASTTDITGQCKQFFDRDQFYLLVTCGFRGLFQVQLTAHRDTEDIDPGPVSPCDQCFEHLLRRHPHGFRGMHTVQIFFVVVVKRLFTGDLCKLYQPYRIRFFCHMITVIIIPHILLCCKYESNEIFGITYGKYHRRGVMKDTNDADLKKEEREQVVELGSDITKSSAGNIYTLTIIGQVEGHQVAPDNVKTTKYEHVLPLLAGIEESEDIDGLLLLLNTVGGDIEAGLAIAEMIAGMKKPTVSLVLGGGHSIGIPLAVCTKKSFITPTASMTVHPVRMTGLVVGAPQTFRYFQRIQEQIADFVTTNSNISREDFERYMMATGEMATDVGTILYGKEAVSSGLIDRLGGLHDALSALQEMIGEHGRRKGEESQ